MNGAFEQLIRTALAEDAVSRDLTARAAVPADQMGRALISAREGGLISGTRPARSVFNMVSADIRQDWLHACGDAVSDGDAVCMLHGSMRALLAAERTALNFLQHLSGIATATNAFVRAVAGTGCVIADTRKTTPGLRHLEKQAVVHGGGVNHRMDLAGGFLIKDNHIAACGSIATAVRACRGQAAGVWIEVECETLDEVKQAVCAEPDIIMLDNMNVDMVRTARGMTPSSIMLEASGGITLDNVRAYAETGVDRLAVGAITHSAGALDLSMQVEACHR